MNKQAIIDVLNSLKVVETNGGDDAYILVENNEENRSKLIEVGVTELEINAVADGETFCLLALAFNCGEYADAYKDGKFILWGPIDDELRNRVVNGEGTAADAERLLCALEPTLGGKVMDQNQTLSESESLMAWLDRRIEHTSCAASFRKYQQKFMELWKGVFPDDEVPKEYQEKVEEKYREIVKAGSLKC